MGFLSSIGKAFTSVVKPVASILDPIAGIASAIGAVTDPVQDLINGGLGYLGAERRNELELANAREVMAFNAREAELNREFNAAEAARARKWTGARATNAQKFYRQMRLTAHQHEAADLAKAGLNRILAVSHPGAGAPGVSSPSGAQASSSPASSAALARVEDALQTGVHTALEARRRHTEVQQMKESMKQMRANTMREWESARNEAETNRLIKEQIRLTKAQSAKTVAESYTEHAREREMNAQVQRTIEQATNTARDTERMMQEIRFRGYGEKGLQTEERIDYGDYGQFMRYMRRFFGSGGNHLVR